MFKKIKEWYYETLNMYRQISLDRKYRKIFLKTIREELANPKSQFVKMNFKLGEDGESINYVINIPAELQVSGKDFMIMDRLNENTYFLTDFLQKAAGGSNYITAPEFFHIEDPSSDGVSVLYLVVWRFNPIIYTSLKIKALSLLYGGIAAIIGALGYIGYIFLV